MNRAYIVYVREDKRPKIGHGYLEGKVRVVLLTTLLAGRLI